MKVINLFGAPGSGKSTTAAMLFALLKLKNINCELVTEFAKELTWAERQSELNDQLFILATQNHRLEILKNKVNVAITDSPLFLSLVYCPDRYYISFKELVKNVFDSYDNINFLIKRMKPYNPAGRNQNENQSNQIGEKIECYLKYLNIRYIEIDGNSEAAATILTRIENKL